MGSPLQIYPLRAAVQTGAFDLLGALDDAMRAADFVLADGDILAVSSKYSAISQGRVVELGAVTPTPEAQALGTRYNMDARLVQLIMQEADHIFGGIQLGFLLTHIHGIISPNAGLDRSNIPSGQVVLFPKAPYATAAEIRRDVRERFGADVGIILTDSWLMPGRWGTTGVALACAGFQPLADERGKNDLFGNPMQVTQRGVADSLCIAAQLVMGERDEATPFAVLRHTNIRIEDVNLSAADVSIAWEQDIYIESLTIGALNPHLSDAKPTITKSS